MEGYKCLIILAFVCGLAKVCSSGSPKVEKIETDLGGGECIDPEDCNNNGICKPESEGKGVCCCAVGFAGSNCDVEDKNAQNSLGPVVPATEVKGSKTGRKRGRLLKNADASKRVLHYDTTSNLVGITPESVEEAEQPVLIYNPSSEKYLFVSKDYKVTGKHNAYVEARGDRLGRRNLFLIKKVQGAQKKYYIFNIEQNAYMYVSNSKSGFILHWNQNVLASTGEPGDGADKQKYIFEFEDDDGDGFYKIKNQEKYVYVSGHRLGIPSYPLVKAATDEYLKRSEAQFFQLTLKENAKNIKFLVTGEEERQIEPQQLIDNQQSSKICYEGDSKNDADQDASLKYTDSSKETRTYTKTHGFSISGDTSGLTASVGKLTFTYKNDQTTTDGTEHTRTVEKSISVKVKPNKCACILITFQSMYYTRQFTLEATTKENKVIKAVGMIRGERLSNFQAHTKMIDNGPNAKCPHEN